MSNRAADAALVELGRAVARAAQALAVLPGNDDLAAYRYVTGLDEALGPLDDLLRAVGGIVDFADAAPAVGRRLAEQEAELARRRSEVNAALAALDALRDAEQKLTDTAAEADRLRARVSELENARRMAAELPSLRAHLRELETSIAASCTAEAARVETELGRAAERLRQLTVRQLEVLSGHVRGLIAEAGTAAAELDRQQARRDAVTAELAEREERAGQLREELERGFPALAAWQQADADLAEGLRQAGLEGGASPLELVRAELADLGQRMSALDERLRPLFAQHTQAYHEARRLMNLSGRDGSRQA